MSASRGVKIALILLWAELFFGACWVLFQTYQDWTLTAAHALIQGRALSFPAPGYPALFVPAILLGWNVTAYGMWVHLFVTLAGVYLFLTEFDIELHWGIAVGVIPYVALTALATTQAVPAFLLLLAVVMLRRGWHWTAWVMLALCYLFRTEYLLWGLLAALWWKGEMK